MLNDAMLQTLQTLWEQGVQHDLQSGRQEQWHNITPDSGRFLYQMVRSSAARRILEVGTSNGFSTLWLALAARPLQGLVTSLDISAARQQHALSNLQSVGVESLVALRCADAGIWLQELEASPLDFLFLDADRSRYLDWWTSIQRVLRPGGLVVMDNALSHAQECAPFMQQVMATEGYLAQTYPIGNGLFVILKDE
jgi:predicted O-methyltransferase YrrM